MRIIGVTGGVGAGKSEVLNYLAERYDAEIFRLDDVARQLQMPGGEIYKAMMELGGRQVLDKDGQLDRKLFAEKMYRDKALREAINEMVHPAVKDEVRRLIAEAEERGCPLCVIEAALLLDDHYGEICDELWYIYASEETRKARLKETRGYSDKLIKRIMKSQLSEEAFRSGCDVLIDNDGEFDLTKEQIDRQFRDPETGPAPAEGV